ncbi:response regulator [Massilia sp. PWRC2]|uniref:response regulator n=1 Tax=Massilia sp. PWRC2 TaxID=2804626 RepID=UPI003CEBC821
MSGLINILIADDHRIVREGVKQVLADAADLRVIAEAHSGPDVITKVAQLEAAGTALDVVLLDIALPERDGLDVLQHLRKHSPGLPVLMLSTYPEKQYAVRCLKLGAAGYLNKSADADDMIAAVRKVAAGGRYVSAATAEALAGAIAAPVKGSASPDALSHREHQVFRLLVTGHSVSEIGAQLGLAANTVSTYRARILEKTGAKNDVALALYAERLATTGPAR